MKKFNSLFFPKYEVRDFINIVEGKTLQLAKNQLPRFRGMYAAFVVVMRPEDFLELTTGSREELESIKARKFPYDKEKFDDVLGDYESITYNRFEIPFLLVKFPSGRVVGHEGRHRAAMVLRDGGKSLPVMICPREEDTHIVTNHFVDQEKPWIDGYYDEEDNWVPPRKNRAHSTTAEFIDSDEANSHVVKHILGDIKGPEGTTYDTSDTERLRGDHQLKGAPARSNGWDKAAWTVEDFPDRLVGQFNRYNTVAKSRIKIGLVKGYKHHFDRKK